MSAPFVQSSAAMRVDCGRTEAAEARLSITLAAESLLADEIGDMRWLNGLQGVPNWQDGSA